MPPPQDATLTELCLKTIIKTHLIVYVICDSHIEKKYCNICHPEISTFLNSIIPGLNKAIKEIYDNSFDHYIPSRNELSSDHYHFRDLAKAQHFLQFHNAQKAGRFTYEGVTWIKGHGSAIRIWKKHKQKVNNLIYMLRGWEPKSFRIIPGSGIINFYTIEDAKRYAQAKYPNKNPIIIETSTSQPTPYW